MHSPIFFHDEKEVLQVTFSFLAGPPDTAEINSRQDQRTFFLMDKSVVAHVEARVRRARQFGTQLPTSAEIAFIIFFNGRGYPEPFLQVFPPFPPQIAREAGTFEIPSRNRTTAPRAMLLLPCSLVGLLW